MPSVSLTSLDHAPMAATIEFFRRRHLSVIPRTGLLSCTTPALFDAWFALSADRYCSIPLARLLEPAIGLANDGITASGQFQKWTQDNYVVLTGSFASIYAPAAGVTTVGSCLRQPGLAKFYHLVEHSEWDVLRTHIGRDGAKHFFAEVDMKRPHTRSGPTPFRRLAGWKVMTTPPPTQGVLRLRNLVLFEKLCTDRSDLGCAENIHLLSEIFNQTLGWRLLHLSDPEFDAVPDALDTETLSELASGVDLTRRSPSRYAGWYSTGDTTHFVVADREGNVVTWAQSLGLGFGAGVGIPEYGMLLCNRLRRSATIVNGQANCCAPGKRPVNTIFPWMATHGDSAMYAGGTPGGDGQRQWNTQILASLILGRLSALDVLSSPRWTYYPGSDQVEARMQPALNVDDTLPLAIRTKLEKFGHRVAPKANVGGVSRLLRIETDHLWALDDGRQEGLTAGR